MDLKLANLSRKHKPNTTWPKEKRIQAVAQYLVLGNMKLVEATTGVSHGMLRQWKLQPWWKEYEREIRATENIKMDSDLTKIVERSLVAVTDRLDNGEVFYDQRSGELRRKPVSMKDAAKVSVDLLTKRELLRGNATSRVEAAVIPMADQLAALAVEFARMSTGKPAEVIDVEAKMVQDIEYANQVFDNDEYEDSYEVPEGTAGLNESGVNSGEGREDSGVVEPQPTGDGPPWNDNP